MFLDYAREPPDNGCISAEQLMRAVEVRLGRAVFAPERDADLSAEVRARRVRGRFVIDVALFDRDRSPLGNRQLTTLARHCSALDDSLSLVVALAADVHVSPRAAPEETAPATPIVRQSTTPITIPPATLAPRLGVRLEPSLGVAVLVGALPAPTWGIELGLSVRAGSFWPVSLRGSGWWPEQHGVDGGRGARFSAASIELGVCPWEGRAGEVALRGCVSQWFGRIRARGFGFDEDQSSERWAFALGGGAEAAYRLGPVFAAAGIELLAPPVRRRYFFTNVTESTTLHDEPWLFGVAALRLGTEF